MGSRSGNKHTKAYEPSNAEVDLIKRYCSEDNSYLEGGTFVELGALNGLNYRNSYALEKTLGWRGVLIELSIDNSFEVVTNRPTATSDNMAVCGKLSTIHYLSFPGRRDMGGTVEFMPDSQWKIITEGPNFPCKFKDNSSPELLSQVPQVACIGLQMIRKMVVITHVIFLSLGVEGAEYEVLKTLDLKKLTIDVICIKAWGHDPAKEEAIRKHMAGAGFKFDGRCSQNDWFSHPGLRQ